ncbi:hypothetical protein K440DRAFT_636103 [Wilcoxina mikolae CBS 423.85]|nr:hypothetical protein K440DRAFT_636103 [Wilcoxina mikolae CBS 423.85]
MASSAPRITSASQGDVYCRPANWIDVVKFFLLNYGLHAVTVLTDPGSGALVTSIAITQVVLTPLYRDSVKVYPCLTNIHGQFPRTSSATLRHLFGDRASNPNEPDLIRVPFISVIQPPIECSPEQSESPRLELANDYNLIKILAAIAQTVYGALQLYDSRGHQLEKYGYAAYALTVVPYITISLINLLASLCQPHYQSMLIVSYKHNREGRTSSRQEQGSKLSSAAEPVKSVGDQPSGRQNDSRDCELETGDIPRVKAEIGATVGFTYIDVSQSVPVSDILQLRVGQH